MSEQYARWILLAQVIAATLSWTDMVRAKQPETFVVPLPVGATDFTSLKVYADPNANVIVEYSIKERGAGEIRFFNLSQRRDVPIANGKAAYYSSQRQVEAETGHGWTPLNSTIYGQIGVGGDFALRNDSLLAGYRCWWPFTGYITVLKDGKPEAGAFLLRYGQKKRYDVSIDCEGVRGRYRIDARTSEAGVSVWQIPNGGFMLSFNDSNCFVMFDSVDELRERRLCGSFAVVNFSSVSEPYRRMAEGTIRPKAAVSLVDRAVGRIFAQSRDNSSSRAVLRE